MVYVCAQDEYQRFRRVHRDGDRSEVLTQFMCVPTMNIGALGACTKMSLSQKC